jgi:hypothetical protein
MDILATFQVLLVVIAVILVIQTLILRCHPGFRRRRSRPATAAALVPVDVFPGISVTEHATVDEQRALIEQLVALPQIRRLPDGSLIDGVNGSRLSACEGRHGKTTHHLQLEWPGNAGLGLISRTTLAHYLGYQRRIAELLSGRAGTEGGAR